MSEMTYNGDFEFRHLNLNGPSPTQGASNVDRRVGLGYDVEWWQRGSWGTPDWLSPDITAYAPLWVPFQYYAINTFDFNSVEMYNTQLHRPSSGNSYTQLLFNVNNLAYPGASYREYLTEQLLVPLSASEDYYVEFYSAPSSINGYHLQELGLDISIDDPYSRSWAGNFNSINYGLPIDGGTTVPEIRLHDNTTFNVAGVWSRTAGCFKPTQTLATPHITIGAFQPDDPDPQSILPFTPANGPGMTDDVSLYFIDDVSIRRFPTAGPDQTVCGTTATLGEGCELPTSSGASYHWDGPDGLSVTSGTPFLNLGGSSPYPLTSGTYALTVSVPNLDGSPNYTRTTQCHVTAFDIPNGVVYNWQNTQQNTPQNPAPGLVVWTGDMNVRGTVRIQSGVTLEIKDAATIHFDDTRTVPSNSIPGAGLLSRIVVEPGGTLYVHDEATLTSRQGGCLPAGRMWDGIVALGNVIADQAPPLNGVRPQATVFLDNCTIENARYGVMAGRSAYSSVPPPSGSPMGTLPTWQVTTQTTEGGAVIQATAAHFVNCYAGVYMAKYENLVTGKPNKSSFTECEFTGNALLADPIYATSATSSPANTRYGMRYGVMLREVRGVAFNGCLFSGFTGVDYRLRGYGIYSNDATFKVECNNYDEATETCLGLTNTFRNFDRAIYLGNSSSGGELTAIGNLFYNNYGGISLTGAQGSKVRGNVFKVGASGVAFGFGLGYNSASQCMPEANRFLPYAGTNNRGLIIASTSANTNPTYNNGRNIVAYRNRFEGPASGSTATKLDIGLYCQFANPGLKFRCNEFAPGMVTTADVQVYAGAIYLAQSACNPNSVTSTSNNKFSRTCTSPSTYYGLMLWQEGRAFNYDYPQDPTPRTCSSSAINRFQPKVNQIFPATLPPQTVSGGQCPYPLNDEDGCVKTDLHRPISTLRALRAATTDAYERGLLLNEMVVQFLTDDAIAHGLDSAIAVLQAENNPEYQTWLNQLLVRAGQYGGASSRAAAPGGRKWWKTDRTTTVARITSATDYATRVLDLLVPLGSDSARTVAIATDAALRAELVQMAEDSVTWGSYAARVALNRYAGTNYREGFGEGDAFGGAAFRQTAPPVAEETPAEWVKAVPNPSDGQVTISYQLSAERTQAELVLYDGWGKEAGRYTLNPEESGKPELALRLRPGFYQAVLRTERGVVARERLLITR